jgi:hypothetical protein
VALPLYGAGFGQVLVTNVSFGVRIEDVCKALVEEDGGVFISASEQEGEGWALTLAGGQTRDIMVSVEVDWAKPLAKQVRFLSLDL